VIFFLHFLKKYRLKYRGIFLHQVPVPVPRYFFKPSTEYRYRGTFTKYRAHLCVYDILIFEKKLFRKLDEGNFISGRGSDGLDSTLPITTA